MELIERYIYAGTEQLPKVVWCCSTGRPAGSLIGNGHICFN